MRRGKLFSTLFFFIVTAIFVYGLLELLVLRFEKGDAYPPYSSYRSDPLGTKAFYEGLSLLPGVDAGRNVEPMSRISGLSEATVFLFGFKRFDFSAMPQASVKAMEDGALEGGRVVISFAPTDALPLPPSKGREKEEKDPDKNGKQNEGPDKNGTEQKDEEEKELYFKTYVDVAARWSVHTELSADHDAEAHLSFAEKDLPASLAWHTTLVFKPQDDAWRTIYARAGKPVLIERAYGKGSIVLSSDSFFLSNEAMKNSRYPHLLSWLCGTHQKLIFDETHLGVSKSPGIATLLRRHGLTPFFASLILLALLAIWRQSVSLVPVFDEGKKSLVDTGKDYSTGLTNLLRRNIPPDDLLAACLAEWRQSFTHGGQDLSGLLSRMEEIIAADHGQQKKRRNPVKAYRKISTLIASYGQPRRKLSSERGDDRNKEVLWVAR